MPPARHLLESVICALLLLRPISAGGQPLRMERSGEVGLSAQSYHGSGVEAQTLARTLGLRLALRRDDGWGGRLALRHEGDLYLASSAASLGLGFSGERLDLNLDAALARNGEGALTSPLLIFDPDSLESQIAVSQAYWQRRATASLGWASEGWDGGLEAALGDLDYDERSDVLADRRELRLDGRLGWPLGAEGGGRLELGLGQRLLDYRGRDGSDRQEQSGSLRLGRELERGELALLAEAERHDPRSPEALAYYERPDGDTWTLGGEALLFLPRSDWSLRLAAGREDWADRDNSYFHAGSTVSLEALGGLRVAGFAGRPLRLDLALSGEHFGPDDLPSADELQRPRELRLEGGVHLDWNRAGRFPLGLGLRGETLRQEADSVDRFRLLEASLAPGWRPGPAWLLSLALRVDHYRSRYGGEDEGSVEGEWELSSALSVRWVRPDWRVELRLARQEYYSFLLDGQASRDAEAGLWIRWHP